nr:hypothetical protein [Chloroflexota bacterium]
ASCTASALKAGGYIGRVCDTGTPPHGHRVPNDQVSTEVGQLHLSDALPKLQGLASFAEKYGDAFLRMEAISQIDKKELRMLDLTDKAVRKAVWQATSATGLFQSDVAVAYV